MKNIVIVGGGTGTSVVARALKTSSQLHLTVIVTVFDSGGSAGLVLDEHGALPASDAIQSILALMPEGGEEDKRKLETLRTMLSFRFDDEPPISGRRLGSYMMVPLERAFGFDEAIKRLCDIYQTVGDVIPVATSKSTLVAHYSNGQEVYGESEIDEPKPDWQKSSQITNIRIEPEVRLNPRARKAILEADYIIFGPGDLYTSVLPNVVVTGFSDAISLTKAKCLMALNIMNKLGQTSGYYASKHVETLEYYLGKRIDKVIVPTGLTAIPKHILKNYESEGAYPIIDDLPLNDGIVRADLVSGEIYQQRSADQVRRSLVRHDPVLLGKVLETIINK